MNVLMKPVVASVLRHVFTIAGTLLAAYGISIDAGTTEAIVQIVLGLVFTGGAVVAGSIDKIKPKVVQDIVSTLESPKGFYFGLESKAKLVGVDDKLVRLMEAAIVNSPYDFKIIQGLRTATEQEQMRRSGKSQVKRSKHQDGLAVDIMAYDENGKPTWEFKYYKAIAEHVKQVALNEDVDIVWGGDWKTLVDGVHYELV